MNSMVDDDKDPNCPDGNCGSQKSKGPRSYQDGCVDCGEVKPIAAGTVEEGYECMDCWEKHGTKGPTSMVN